MLDFLPGIAKTLSSHRPSSISISHLGVRFVVSKMNSTDATDLTGCFVEFLVLAVEVEDGGDHDDDGDEEMQKEYLINSSSSNWVVQYALLENCSA